ncbi:hypothetical protein QE152_g8765 [Popillia japonica]|uniref:G kinase-anchoring protein 1 n=1 Tax=Popillia japonica TaxID=7064 RepID=A0AAW1M0T7_POPJA
MDISVPSRFACLKLVDDDYESDRKVEKKKEKPITKKVEKPITRDVAKKVPSNKQNNHVKKEKKMKVMSDKQWEEWKQKDDEFVNGNFEQDLQSAILLSKLEYESKKDTVKKVDKDDKKNDKKKKTKTMSLDEFLGANEQKQKESEVKVEKTEKDENFFERVKLEAKEEFTKEKVNENRKNRQANIEEIISSAQYQEKLLIERQKNTELREELEKLKIEIADVKKRNKTLCGILGHGEMKDKADVLMELERLNNVKNELTDEVAKLHGLLEQERSKVAALTVNNNIKVKDKKHKKHA